MPTSLTAEQEAVASLRGSAVVSAVAGSGKSETLLHLVERRVRGGLDPQRILIVMYNRSARDGFQARLRERLKSKAPAVYTFHGLGHRICQAMEAEGILPPARLAEPDQLAMLARRAIVRANPKLSASNRLDETDPDAQAMVLTAIDHGKNTNEEPPAPFDQLFEAFELERLTAGLRSFNDLILDPLTAIDTDPHAASLISGGYALILIDEFQDINEAQMRLIRVLAGKNAEVIAVGDDDQTIYAWRGARADYQVREFEKLFPGARRLQLSRTFRYGHTLALAANSLIAHNPDRHPKESVSAAPHATDIQVLTYQKDPGEAVLAAISAGNKAGHALADTALLVRQFAHAIPIEFALHRQGLAYRIEGGEPFFRRPEIQALRGWLAIACGGLNDDTPLEVIEALLRIPGLYLPHRELTDLINQITVKPSAWLTHLEKAAPRQSAQVQKHLLSLLAIWRDAAKVDPDSAAHPYLSKLISQLGVQEALKKRYPLGDQALEHQQLITRMILQAKADQLSIAALAGRINAIDRAYDADHPQALHILSMHRAKGLEWRQVIIGPLAEGEFPSNREDTSIEDERRLMYVAMTRARERLVLLTPQDAHLSRQMEEYNASVPDTPRASRFLFEADLGTAMAAGHVLATGKKLPAALARKPHVKTYLAAQTAG